MNLYVNKDYCSSIRIITNKDRSPLVESGFCNVFNVEVPKEVQSNYGDYSYIGGEFIKTADVPMPPMNADEQEIFINEKIDRHNKNLPNILATLKLTDEEKSLVSKPSNFMNLSDIDASGTWIRSDELIQKYVDLLRFSAGDMSFFPPLEVNKEHNFLMNGHHRYLALTEYFKDTDISVAVSFKE